MQLHEISDPVLADAVRSQETDEFDTHGVIFWICGYRAREYAADLHAALDDQGDPFSRLHTAIGWRLARLPDLVEKQGRRRSSLNVRGKKSRCAVWRRRT